MVTETCILCPARAGPGYVYFRTVANGRVITIRGGLCETCGVRFWKHQKRIMSTRQIEIEDATTPVLAAAAGIAAR